MSTLTKNKKPNAFVRLTKHSEFTIGLVVIALFLLATFLTKNFFGSYNLKNLTKQGAIVGVLAVAQTFIIITSGIDISGGAIAGLGGSAELLGTQFRLINGFGAGYGFDGVAMALIGQLHPIATMVVALFFAVLRVGSTTMQAATGVPTSVSDIIQALVIVFSVAGMALTKLPEFQSWKSRVFGKRKAGAV